MAARLIVDGAVLETLPAFKTCARCKQERTRAEFGVNRSKTGDSYVLASYCRPCANAKARRYRKYVEPRVRKARWEQKLLLKYGLDAVSFEGLLEEQSGACKLCGAVAGRVTKDGRRFRLFVDHDHQTGAVRGLLCSTCNAGLGHLGDTIEGLERALRYLKGEL